MFKEVRLYGSPFSLPSMGYVPPGDAGCGMKMDLYIFESSLYSIVVTIAEGFVSRAKRHLENNIFFLLKNTRFPDLTTKMCCLWQLFEFDCNSLNLNVPFLKLWKWFRKQRN